MTERVLRWLWHWVPEYGVEYRKVSRFDMFNGPLKREELERGHWLFAFLTLGDDLAFSRRRWYWPRRS
jgi:hypothetical protein